MKHLLLLFIFVSQFSFSQNKKIKVSLFNKDSISRFTLLETGLNQPGGPDTTNSIIELKKKGGIYSFQYIEISPKSIEVYNSKTLKSILFTFKLKYNSEIEVLVNNDAIMNSLRKDLIAKYGKDTAAFGEYFFMMYSPDLLIQDKFLKQIEILKIYLNNEITNSKNEVYIPSMTGLVPANNITSYITNKDQVSISNKILTDSTKVRSYLYEEGIKKNGDAYKEIFKEKDMVYVPTTITTMVTGEKEKLNETYLIKQLDYEHKHNQGNPFDIIDIIKIKKVF
ncbi:MAG: hypothetical protein Q7W45_11360 [Bacteroidota bacterium]|nr:hypothetical protein [Bacteroidota bacterium]MDP3147077.1 hypothetical protein [Bacteroidota bacterium]